MTALKTLGSRLTLSIILTHFLLFLTTPTAIADGMKAFGGKADIQYAKDLWQLMLEEKLVGEHSIKVMPFKGNQPHGAIQEVLTTKATLDGHTGKLIVKRNHGGKDLTPKMVYDNPNKYLKAITIMFKREKGYDPEHQDWFWAKYLPTGQIDTNPKKVKLAGQVAKTPMGNKGCLACHIPLGGSDLETLTSK